MTKLEFILSRGEVPGLIKLEFGIDGIKQERADTAEISESEVVKLTEIFYRNLKMNGIIGLRLSFINKGIDPTIYERIKKRVSEEIPYLNAHNN